MKILILGDVHGKFDVLQEVVRNGKNTYGIQMVFQVGDFGFFKSHLSDKLSVMSPFAVPVYAIDGNHEDHDLRANMGKKNVSMLNEKNLFLMKRGQVIEVEGRTVCFVGGAMNVDRRQYGNTKKRTTNFLTNNECKEIYTSLNSINRNVDLMVTHSCPHSIGVGMEGHPMFLPYIEMYIEMHHGVTNGPLDDCGEEVLRILWNHLVQKPINWVFGHFHKHHFSVVGNTNFWCVGCVDDSDGVMYTIPYIYDTETNSVIRIESERI